MRSLIILFVCISGLLNPALDSANGFGIFKFGTSPQDYKNLEIEIEEGNVKVFTVNDNSISIDGVAFENIRVSFCRNKLSAIYLTTTNTCGSKILDYFQKLYGKPATVKGHFEWMGPKMQVIFERAMFNKEAIVSFYSREIYDHK